MRPVGTIAESGLFAPWPYASCAFPAASMPLPGRHRACGPNRSVLLEEKGRGYGASLPNV